MRLVTVAKETDKDARKNFSDDRCCCKALRRCFFHYQDGWLHRWGLSASVSKALSHSRNLVPERKQMGLAQPECCYDTVQNSGNTHQASHQHICYGLYQEWAQVGRRSMRGVGAKSTSLCPASRGARRQLGVWLLLLVDEGREAAPQLRDQEYWSEPLQRPTLNKLDALLQTYKAGTGGLLECIKRGDGEAVHRHFRALRVTAAKATIVGTHRGVAA